MTRYLALFVATLGTLCPPAMAQNHLEPEEGILSRPSAEWEYQLRVRELLLKDAPRSHLARLVCLPSFEREWAVTLVREEGEDFDAPHTYYVEYAVAEKQIYSREGRQAPEI